MAEKGFGVKEINLIGPSGTPTITSPNNLNLNAVNVAISTNVSIGGTLTVSGNLSIGGTITYEDVTNIDAVGVITAREGIRLPDSKKIQLGGAQDLEIFHNGSDSYIDDVGTGRLNIRGSEVAIGKAGTTTVMIRAVPDAQVDLYYAGVNRLKTSSSGVTVTGTLSATTFSGSGASLTNLPVSDSDIQVAYNVTANGSSAYNFSGNGSPSGDNPDLYLIRGQKYRFINNSGGSHPFQIRVSNGGSAYSTGVTNNGAASGNIDFAPTFDSPSSLVYQCTSHGAMVGNIYISNGKYDTKANHPGFFAYMDGGNQTTNASSVIPFNLTHFNTGGHFKTSGTNAYKFVCPVAGIYHFSGAMWMKNQNTGAHARWQIRKNNAIQVQAGWHQNANNNDFYDHSAPAAITVYCDASDTVYAYADYQIQYWRGGSSHPHSYFSGHFVG